MIEPKPNPHKRTQKSNMQLQLENFKRQMTRNRKLHQELSEKLRLLDLTYYEVLIKEYTKLSDLIKKDKI